MLALEVLTASRFANDFSKAEISKGTIYLTKKLVSLQTDYAQLTQQPEMLTKNRNKKPKGMKTKDFLDQLVTYVQKNDRKNTN